MQVQSHFKPRSFFFRLGLGLGLILSTPVRAQAAAQSEADVAKLVQRLAERVEALETQRSQDQATIETLRERLASLEESTAERNVASSAPLTQVSQPSSPSETSTANQTAAAGGDGGKNAFNPAITAIFDMGGSLSTNGQNKASNRFNLRETELQFSAAVHPKADAQLTLAIGEEIEVEDGEAEIEYEFAVEEAFLHFHTLPKDTSLKLGKFRNHFGRINLLHTHDLPQVTRPLALQNFLGPEGLATIGVSGNWIIPNPWEKYIELTAEVINSDGGGESPFLGGPNAHNPAALAHLKFFDDVSENASLELGASYLHGSSSSSRDDSGHLVGLDATYLWRDPAQPDSRSFLAQAEGFWFNGDVFDEDLGKAKRHDAFGAYAFGQYQFARNWYTGLRYDYSEFIRPEGRFSNDSDWGTSAYLTWYWSEFLRFRLEYAHLAEEIYGRRSHEDQLWLGVTFSIGAHPAHPYWVNR